MLRLRKAAAGCDSRTMMVFAADTASSCGHLVPYQKPENKPAVNGGEEIRGKRVKDGHRWKRVTLERTGCGRNYPSQPDSPSRGIILPLSEPVDSACWLHSSTSTEKGDQTPESLAECCGTSFAVDFRRVWTPLDRDMDLGKSTHGGEWCVRMTQRVCKLNPCNGHRIRQAEWNGRAYIN